MDTEGRTDVTGWPVPPGGWPEWLWRVPYLASAYPGAPDLGPVAAGANCQRFAYAVLGLFGRMVPPWRSSELWSYGRRVTGPAEPLDLLLVGAGTGAYGAHVGVWMAPGRVLHLCAEVGRPAVWSVAGFRRRERYRAVVGMVRVEASRR